jgi:Lon protease-like protein
MQLDLFPLHTVLFPGSRLPLHIFEPRYLNMIGECVKNNSVFGVTLIADGEEVGEAAVPHGIGTTARIQTIEKQPDGPLDIVVVGEARFQIDAIMAYEPHVVADVAFLPLPENNSKAVRISSAEVRKRFDRLVTVMVEIQSGYMPVVELPSDMIQLAYLVAAGMPSDHLTAQRLLEAPTLQSLFEMEQALLDERIEQAMRLLHDKLNARRN